MCFMFIVHSRWIRVAQQPRGVVGVRPITGEPCVQFVSGASREQTYM